MGLRFILRFGGVFALGITIGTVSSDYALAQTPYFQGKTVTIYRGGEPGGSGDMQARALIHALKKQIPGAPTIIIENMPGAAGMKAVNYIYSTGKPDGLSIAAVGAGLVAGPILGLAGVKYDLDKLIYLGSTESGDPYIFVSRKQAGFDTLEKLRVASGVRIGAQAVGHPVYVSGRIFATLVSVVSGLPAYDTQCGLKILTRQAFDRVRAHLVSTGFAFDVELCLLLLKTGNAVVEFPLDWADVPGSKLHLFRDSIKMTVEVFKIRRRIASLVQ